MDKTEIKKALYRLNPPAFLSKIRMGIAYYHAFIDDGDEDPVEFEVPVSDMGDADFEPTMKAKHLIRWIV